MISTDKLLVNIGNPFMCEECVGMIKVGDIYLEREYKMPSGDIIHSQYCKKCLPSKMYEYVKVFENDKYKPTEKQISYIKGICEVLEIDYNEPKTKDEASLLLNKLVPIYKRRCEENELEWEANHSDIMNNYGDWRD